MNMRVWQLTADNITSDNVAYSTATPASGLTLTQNSYLLGVGDNVLKYRQIEILDTVEWLKDEAMAQMDTTRFPRPAYGATGGGTYFKAKLITTAFGQKWLHTLVTNTDLTTPSVTDEDAVWWGIQVGTAALAVNDAAKIANIGMDTAFEEIKQFYIQSAQASS
jgi:hypothetical protein